jgi:hypothetical protein
MGSVAEGISAGAAAAAEQHGGRRLQRQFVGNPSGAEVGTVAEPAMATAPAAAEAMVACGKIQPLRAFLGALFFLHGWTLRLLQFQCVCKALTRPRADTNCRHSPAALGCECGRKPAEWAREPDASGAEPPTPATVLTIGDGDTLRVKQGGRTITVGLACIDAPEIARRPHAPRAREYLQLRRRPGLRLSEVHGPVRRLGVPGGRNPRQP